MLLPKECVFTRFGKRAAYVATPLEEGGKYAVSPRYLDLLEIKDEPGSWHVVRGLAPGDRVVRSKIDTLVPDMIVRDEGDR